MTKKFIMLMMLWWVPKNHYECSSSNEEIEKYATEKEWWSMRFGKDPVWSTYNGKD